MSSTTADVEAYRTPYGWRDEFADYVGPALAPSRLLDGASERPPILNALMDAALLGIALTSDGSTASFDAARVSASSEWKIKVTRQGGGSAVAHSALGSDIASIVRDYERCRTNRARLLVIKEAQEMGAKLRHAPNRAKVPGTKEWKARIVNDPRSSREAAADYGVSHTTVARIRKRATQGRL